MKLKTIRYNNTYRLKIIILLLLIVFIDNIKIKKISKNKITYNGPINERDMELLMNNPDLINALSDNYDYNLFLNTPIIPLSTNNIKLDNKGINNNNILENNEKIVLENNSLKNIPIIEKTDNIYSNINNINEINNNNNDIQLTELLNISISNNNDDQNNLFNKHINNTSTVIETNNINKIDKDKQKRNINTSKTFKSVSPLESSIINRNNDKYSEIYHWESKSKNPKTKNPGYYGETRLT